MTSNPKINPIQTENIMPLHSSPQSITGTVTTAGVSFPPSCTVARGGTVTLISMTGSPVRVFTHVGTALTPVFNEAGPPYSATPGSGTTYTLKSSISGNVSFDLSDPVDAIKPELGGNGTINVGG